MIHRTIAIRSVSAPMINMTIRSALSRNPTLQAGISDSARGSRVARHDRADDDHSGQAEVEHFVGLGIPDHQSDQHQHVRVTVDDRIEEGRRTA